MMTSSPARVTAVLGPTNTGKTHYAIERMLGQRTGVIGLPLRLLARDADDVLALKALADMPDMRDRLTGPNRVKLLWDVCRVPDFRGASGAEHTTLLARIYAFLVGRGLGGGRIPTDWLAAAVARIDRIDGDIDTISKRLAYIRTWTYVAQRKGWVDDENHWRGETRAVEDRLSDALHAALTQRFVDRRTSVLMRRLKQKETLVAEVNDKGEVTVEGEFVGRLEGFRFRMDATSSTDEAHVLRQAAVAALKPEFHLRADRFYNAPDTEMDFTEQGGLIWGTMAVGKLVKGAEVSRPLVEAFVDDEAGADVADKVRRRMQHFIDRKVAALFDPLLAMSRDETLTGLARGFAFRLVENLGVIPRDAVTGEVKELDQEARGALRKHGVRFGQFTVFLPLLLKPAPTRLRLVLWSLFNGLQEFPESPPPGLVTIPNLPEVPKGHYTLSGYHPAGARAIRIDMLERLADLLRARDSRAGFEASSDMLSITGMTLEQFVGLMAGLGYAAEKAERVKTRAAVVVEPVVVPVPDDAPMNPVPEEVSLLNLVPEVPAAEADEPAEPAEPAPEVPPEMETFYRFTWAPRPRPARPDRVPRPEPRPERGPRPDRGPRRDATAPPAVAAAPPEGEAASAAAEPRPAEPRPAESRPEGERRDRRPHGDKRPHGDRLQGGGAAQGYKGKPKGDKPEGRGDRPDPADRGDRFGKDQNRDAGKGPKPYEARPPQVEKPIDPDNPFAVLAALKARL